MKRISHEDVQLRDVPCLVISQGTAPRRYRPLTGDVTIVGRAPTCDIGIESREVSEIHCAICKVPSGYRVRNYAGRNITRLNGDPFQIADLADGDILQVGTFCFQVQLPTPATLPAEHAFATVDAAKSASLTRLERSRRNLAQLALSARKRLRTLREELATAPAAVPVQVEVRAPEPSGPSAEELEQAVVALAEQTREVDLRQQHLDGYADHLNWLRQQLEAEQAKHRAELNARVPEDERQRVEFEQLERDRQQLAREREQVLSEKELATAYLNRQREELSLAEATIVEQREQLELHQRQHADDAADLAKRKEALLVSEAALLPKKRLAEQLERDRRQLALTHQAWRREQEKAAARLDRQRTEATQAEKDLRQQRLELEQLRIEIEEREHAAEHVARAADDQKQAVAHAESVLQTRREELMQMMTQIRQTHQAALQKQSPALAVVHKENLELKDRVAALQRALQERPPVDAPHVVELTRRLDEKDAYIQQMRAEVGRQTQQLTELQSTRTALERELEEREALIVQLHEEQAAAEAAKENSDLAGYEAEVNEFKRKLQQDKMELSQNLRVVKQRSKELDETIRQAEQELAQERKELARERESLEHLRRELQLEVEIDDQQDDSRVRLLPVP